MLAAKSGAGLPPGTYNNPVSGSKVYEVQVAPPVIGTPWSELPHVDTLRGDAPSGPRVGSPSAFGTRQNSHTILPVVTSSAYMRPFAPLMSPPALPTTTNPFQAIGAAGAVSPSFGSPIVVAQIRLPVLKS